LAYGARLESVLGATPREFESRILRHRVTHVARDCPRTADPRRLDCPTHGQPTANPRQTAERDPRHKPVRVLTFASTRHAY
jgi:hypothetical protein